MSQKTIAVFGATGSTGLNVVKELLNKNYKVNAFVRGEEKLGDLASKVTVYKGDGMNYADVEKTIQNADMVISVIGATKNSPRGMQKTVTENIIKAMKQYGKTRLITMTGAGVRAEGDNPTFVDNLIKNIMKVVARKALEEGQEHAEVVKSSNLDWTIVRGPRLTNDSGTGEYVVGLLGDDGIGTQIARADVATFIVATLEENTYYHKMPVVTQK